MALLTGGTNANNSLNAFKFGPMASATDMGTLRELLKIDNTFGLSVPQNFDFNGVLFVPGRGQLQVLAGDYVMVDTTTGWPILVSANAIASGPWHHS